MRRCPKCGAHCETEDRYCGQCGVQLSLGGRSGAYTQKELSINDIRLNLGVVYMKKGNYQSACEVFEKILRENPGHVRAQQLLEESRQKLTQAVVA